MITNLLTILKDNGIKVSDDILKEVLKWADCEPNITQEELLDMLDYGELDYSGSLHENIDSNLNIYYEDLRKWFAKSDNFKWVEQATEEGLYDGTDIHQSIQAGQYLYYQDQVMRSLEEIVEEVESLDKLVGEEV
jgi:hypothetical protein